MKLLPLLLPLLLGACTSNRKAYQASGDCSFKPERLEGYAYTYKVPASGECKFKIESEIKKSKDLEDFAEAFTKLINSGFNAPIVSTVTKGNQ